MPFSFLCANILNDLCSIAIGSCCANGTPISKAGVHTSVALKRGRGTQECVRHTHARDSRSC